MIRFLTLLFFALLRAGEATPGKPNFQDDILPILDQSCNSCHNPDKAKGSLILSTINGVMHGGSSGKVVVPEDGKSSLLYQLAARLKEPHMPPRGQGLETEQVKLLKRWIDQGLLPTSTGKAVKKKTASLALDLKTKDLGKPKGPPPMPSHLNLEPFLVTERAFTPSAMESAPWSPFLAIATPKQIIFYHTETLELLGVLPYPEGFAESLAFSKNGSLLLASGGKGGKMGQVVAWDISSGRRILTLGQEKDSILSVDINPDQSLIAIGGTSKIIKVFELGSGQVLYQIKKHSEWVTKVAISPDGILMATGDRNGGLYIWEAETGNPFYTLSGHQGEITDLSWRADGNTLLSSSEDGSLRIWEMIGGSLVKDWEAHPSGVLSSHFDKNANILSSGRDKKVIYWDNKGNKIRTISGFKDIVTEARFSEDGLKVIASDWQGNITVWNPLNGEKTGSLNTNPPTIETRLNALALKLSQAQKSFSAAQEQAQRSLEKVQEIEDTISRAQKENKDLTNRLKQLENEGHTLEKSLEIETNKISQFDESIATHNLKIKKMETAHHGVSNGIKKEKVKILPQAITDRESILNPKKELSASLAAEVAKREISLTSRDKLNHSIEGNDKKMKQLQESSLALTEKIKEMKKALEVSQEKATASVAALQKTQNELESAQAQTTKWKAARINSQRHAILALYYQAEDEIELLTRQLEQARDAHIRTTQELDQKTGQLYHLPDNITKAREELHRMQLTYQESSKKEKEVEGKLANSLQTMKRTEELANETAKTNRQELVTKAFFNAHQNYREALLHLEKNFSLLKSELQKQKDNTKLALAQQKQAEKILAGLIAQQGELPALIQDKKTVFTTARNSINELEQTIAEVKKLAQEKKKASDLLYTEYLEVLTRK